MRGRGCSHCLLSDIWEEVRCEGGGVRGEGVIMSVWRVACKCVYKPLHRIKYLTFQ